MPRVDNLHFYNQSIKLHGTAPQGVHWNSKESQEIRFEVLLGFIPDLNESSLCDAGCGFGDLYGFMNPKPERYLGIDAHPKMVELARAKYPEATFAHVDVLRDQLEHFDYYLASGSMNILTHKEAHLFIKKCFFYAKKGFVFNLLDATTLRDSSTYGGFKIKEIEKVAKELGADLEVRSDYLAGDLAFSFFSK